VNIRKSVTVTVPLIRKAFGEESMSHTRVEWKNLNSLGMEKVRQVKSEVKGMLIIFFDIKGTVPKEFILAGQPSKTANSCNVLWQLHEQ
jgi:hypothetical protein